MGVLDENDITALLFWRTKSEIGTHFRKSSSTETAVDWTDAATCNELCPRLPEGCAAAALPAYLARMVTALPEAERTALLLKLDGMHPGLIADHMKCGDTTAVRLVTAAILLLQIDNPELSGPAAAVESLAAWEREELAKVSEAKREALLRLDPSTRQAVLLKAQGVNVNAIAKRLGVPHELAAGAARCAAVVCPPAPARKPPIRPASKRTSPQADRMAAVLRREIASMDPGTLLPGERELRARFGVGGSTVERVRDLLCEEGVLEPHAIRGYQVAGARVAVAA